MIFKKLSFFFLFVIFLSGCAPATTDSTPNNSSPARPQRPQSSGDIFTRNLLYKIDRRISYCEILENQNSTYSGMRDTSLYPLASLSKLIMTTWALEKLGADFRFQSEVYLNSVDAAYGVYDIFLDTQFDPIVNIEKLLYFISEMNRAGVKQIRKLTISQSTRIFLGVLSNPHIELEHTPISFQESVTNLNLILNSKNWAEKTKSARNNLIEWSLKNNRTVQIPDQFSVGTIVVGQLEPQKYQKKLLIPSAPLYRYLKNLNVYSNNYVADALFNYLGGMKAFRDFQRDILSLSRDELKIYTGSGLPDSSLGSRLDNFGSCFAMIKVLAVLRNKARLVSLNLGHLLLNPSLDKNGTFESESDYRQSVVLKTGRLYELPALNLAGYVATDRGVVSFVFLGHEFLEGEAHDIEIYRYNMLNDLFRHYSTRGDFLSLNDSEVFL